VSLTLPNLKEIKSLKLIIALNKDISLAAPVYPENRLGTNKTFPVARNELMN
jgi:hypothetical protein